MKRATGISLALLVLSASVTLALAQQNDGFLLRQHSIDGGGGSVASGNLKLNGSMAQPAAGQLGSGRFVLQGGFLPGVVSPNDRTPTVTPTGSPGVTPTPTATLTVTPSSTPTGTGTATPTATPTGSPALTPTATPSATATGTPPEKKVYLPLILR